MSAIDHIIEARERWQPLPKELRDPRMFSTEDAVVWGQPGMLGTSIRPDGWDVRFQPDYDPVQMMAMGIFGDAYWGDPLGQSRAAMLPQYRPFTRGGQHYTNHRGSQGKRLNYYGRPASLTREWWLDKGLISSWDPLGWFEWYCWYWLGRRLPIYDRWQVARWLNFRDRHLAMYYATRYPGNAQALLHWGIRVEHNF